MARIIEIDKTYERGTIYVQGTGNARNRSGITPLLKAVVKKVNPKSVVITIGQREVKLDRRGNTSHNYGYDMYASIDDFMAEKFKADIHSKFDHHCRDNVDTETTLKIAELLGVTMDIQDYLVEQ